MAAASSRASLAGWALLIAGCWLWGTLLNASGAELHLHAPPLLGTWNLRVPPATLVPVAVAAGLVAAAPLVTRRARWPVLLVVAAAAQLAWVLALALVDGLAEIEQPLRLDTQYLLAVDQVTTPGEFLATFVDRVDAYPTHVRAHPPSVVLAFWALAQAGLGGSWPAAAAILLLAVTAVPAVLVTARAIAGEDAARRAAPFLVLTPAALAIGTTADAAFAAVGAWAVAALVLAIERRSLPLAAVGGLLFGALIFCSYGLVLVGAVPLAVAVRRRRVAELAVATAVVGVVVLGFALAGFWWLEGLLTTRREYLESAAMSRPYAFFVFNNLAAFAVALGPAVALGLAALRCPKLWLLVGGGIAAALLANLSGMSKAEVERIWLPFAPWIVLAVAALPVSRRLLAAQAGLTLAVVVAVRTPW